MPQLKRDAMVASTLMLIAIIASACQRPFSQQPSVTNTPIDPNSFFTTPIAQTPDITMSDVANFGTGTANAAQGTAPATAAAATTAVGITPQASATITPTPIINLPATFTPTATLAVSGSPAATAVASGSEWVLQKGEFPYCIARRYNVNPEDLLRLSGLTSPDIYYEGQKMIIPQNSAWPASLGPRGLSPTSRPGTYTVTGNSDTTVYGVACKYGDVLPSDIASLNGISVGAVLSIGQQVKIP